MCRDGECPFVIEDASSSPASCKAAPTVECPSRVNFLGIAKSNRFLHGDFSSPSLLSVHSTAEAADIFCRGMSDPFLVRDANETWYLFAARSNECCRSEIAVSVSHHGLASFRYQQVVLSEPWSLARPHVVRHGGSRFMLTSAAAVAEGRGCLWLYESAGGDWPLRWERRSRLLEGPSMLQGRAVNPVLYLDQRDATWYLLVFDDGVGRERLFFSARIHAGYVEHPESQKYAWRHAGPLVVDTAHPLSPAWALVHTSHSFAANGPVVALRLERLSRSEYLYSAPPDDSLESGRSESALLPRISAAGFHQVGPDEWVLMMHVWSDASGADAACAGSSDASTCWRRLWDSAQRRVLGLPPREAPPPQATAAQSPTRSCLGDCSVVNAAKRIFSLTKDWVIVIVFNSAYIPMTKSWLCNTESMKRIWRQTLFVSSDPGAVYDMLAWNSSLNLVQWDTANDYSDELKFGQVQYFHLMRDRLSLVLHILEAGVPILLAETDSVWTSDALHTVPAGADWDIAAAWDMMQYMMGFMFIRPTEASLAAFRTIHDEYESILLQYLDEENDFVIDLNDRAFAGDSIMFLNYVRSHQGQLKAVVLDLDMHVGGNWYVERSRSKCVTPVTIQNNWLVGNERKVARMREFGQWFLADDDATCAANSPAQIFHSASKWVRCASSGFVGLCGPGCIGSPARGRFWARSLDAGSVVYSFGFGEDLSFEIGLAARYGVTVHLFDPSARALEHFLWVQEILDRGVSQKSAPAVANMSGDEFRDLVRGSTVNRDQLVFHPVAIAATADAGAAVCFQQPPSNPRHGQTLCRGVNCSCQGQSAAAKSLNAVMKELGHVGLDLVVLDIGGQEANVALHLQGAEPPRYLLIEVHEPTSNLSLLSSMLTKYNLVKRDGRYGTWKLRRCASILHILSFVLCPPCILNLRMTSQA